MATKTTRYVTEEVAALYKKYRDVIPTESFKEIVKYGRVLYALRVDESISDGIMDWSFLNNGNKVNIKLPNLVSYDNLDLSIGLVLYHRIESSVEARESLMEDIDSFYTNVRSVIINTPLDNLVSVNNKKPRRRESGKRTYNGWDYKPRRSNTTQTTPSRTITVRNPIDEVAISFLKGIPINERLDLMKTVLSEYKDDATLIANIKNIPSTINKRCYIRMSREDVSMSSTDRLLALRLIAHKYKLEEV